MWKRLTALFYSFPVQLVLLQLRNHLVLLFLWAFLATLVTGVSGKKYGISYLFLSAEYLGRVDFWSFFFIGFGFGALVMSWNLTTYLTSAHYFPFLACLSRPFIKFCLNNFILPSGFIILFIATLFRFSAREEGFSFGETANNALGFFFGGAALLITLFVYFHFTNKDIGSYFKVQPGFQPRPPDKAPIRWRVDNYLSETLRVRLVRSVAHYESTLLLRIFKQNHINALIVQLVSLIALVVLGYLIDYKYFKIPAGASILLFVSVLIALVGAVSYWFQGWRMAVFLILILAMNYVTRLEWLNHKNKAYGLDYQTDPACYDYEMLSAIHSPSNIRVDKEAGIAILENWKRKQGKPRPKLVVFCASGGGLKSAVWTMQVLRMADSLTNQALTRHTVLMAGASGGVMGEAYYRELFLRKQQGEDIDLYAEENLRRISRDLLNSVSFTIISNDLFLPWVEFEAGGHTYVKDRGYVFERQLNENVEHVFGAKTVSDYWGPEQKALVPMLFVTPAIVNDGRRMIISPHGVSYMMASPFFQVQPQAVEIDAVDFGRMFDLQDGHNLLFSSALRMNATFPYILPNVHLPSEPEIELMDAGFRDDFGLKTATRFLHVYQDWIRENTSGVVLVQVRAFDRDREVPPSGNKGVIESIFNPLGIAGQIIHVQNYEHDNDLGFMYEIFGRDRFEIVRFTYFPSGKDEASISFHLTQREYRDILGSIRLPVNKQALDRLVTVLK